MTKESKQVVATEVAESEFERWAEAMDLDFDPKGWDEEDKKSFRDAKNRLVRAMERGHLVVDEQDRMVYTPQVGEDRERIVWNELSGKDLSAMDQMKKGHDVDRTFVVMARMTGRPHTLFQNMKGRDLKICQAIYSLFLAS